MTFSVLHSRYVLTLPFSGRKPFPSLHPPRLEGVFLVQSPGDGGVPTVPLLRGAALRNFHRGDARHPGPGYLERRDGHRAAEEGGGALGEEVQVEKHPGRVRPLLHRVVLAVRAAHAKIQIRELFILGVIMVMIVRRVLINVIGLT